MNEHIHKFEHIGGGCNLVTEVCDDSYECECGAKLRIESNQEVHFTMPEVIEGKKSSESSE